MEATLVALPSPLRVATVREAVTSFAVHLEDQIQTRLHGRIRNFEVFCADDGLILRGQVPSYYVKQLVQHAVMSECLTPIRANQIEVIRQRPR